MNVDLFLNTFKRELSYVTGVSEGWFGGWFRGGSEGKRNPQLRASSGRLRVVGEPDDVAPRVGELDDMYPVEVEKGRVEGLDARRRQGVGGGAGVRHLQPQPGRGPRRRAVPVVVLGAQQQPRRLLAHAEQRDPGLVEAELTGNPARS